MYPWRVEPSPYRTLVSEVMLQQTQANRVVPAFERFVSRFADVGSLAAAPRADVLRAWDGLGYNRRAVALSRAARAIVRDHAGRVPSEPTALQALPGVGPYTAAAVASLGYGRPVAVVDVNVRRVVARWALRTDPSAASNAEIADAAAWMVDHRRPAAWNQALMDLGREVCRPRAPRCRACPIEPWCGWRRGSARARAVAPTTATARRAARDERFEGSFRQVRGGVLRVLRARPATEARIARELGRPIDEVRRAGAALEAEGAVERVRGGGLRLAESERSNGAGRPFR